MWGMWIGVFVSELRNCVHRLFVRTGLLIGSQHSIVHRCEDSIITNITSLLILILSCHIVGVFVDKDLFVITNIKCYYYSLKITISCVKQYLVEKSKFTDKDPNSRCFYFVSSPHLHCGASSLECIWHYSCFVAIDECTFWSHVALLAV